MWERISSSMSRSSRPQRRSRSRTAAKRIGSNLLGAGAQHGGNGRYQPIPALGFVAQAFYAFAREPVILGAALILGDAPLGGEQIPFFQAVEGGIERALLHQQSAGRNLLDAQKHPIAVQRAERDSFQDEQVESSGKQFGFGSH